MVQLLLGFLCNFTAASELVKKVGFAHLQLSLARQLLVIATNILCVSVVLPVLLGRQNAQSLLRGSEKIWKAQGTIIFGIIAPPNSLSTSVEYSCDPEADGSVTVAP